jgi:hypothetical protein
MAGLLGLMAVACGIGGGYDVGEQAGAEETTEELEARPVAGRPVTLDESGYTRLFSDDSPFNQPIPPDALLDPNSEAMVQAIIRSMRRGCFSISVGEFSVPVYYAGEDTPRHDVAITDRWSEIASMNDVPIPDGAQPDPEDDGHLAIIDLTDGCQYEFWRARPGPDGGWEAQWGNAISIYSDGVYPAGGSSRASGIAATMGLMWPQELIAGEIDHALAFSYGFALRDGPVWPATETDGLSPDPGAIPEGARVRLDPHLNLDTLDLTPLERTIAEALTEYGMFLVDINGSSPELEIVNPISLPPGSYQDLIPEDEPWVCLNIPVESLQVLELPPVNTDSPYDPYIDTGCNGSVTWK